MRKYPGLCSEADTTSRP